MTLDSKVKTPYTDGMKTLRRATKYDILINLFEEIGSQMTVSEICEITGIKSYNTLKAAFSYIRRSKHVPDESRIDVRIQGDICIRVK